MLNKIIKWSSWALMLIGVIFTIMVFASNGSMGTVNTLLVWAYVMLAISVAAILFGIYRDVIVNKGQLVRMGIIIGGAVVLVLLAYLIAPGTPAVGYVGAPVDPGTLKLTDTILILTYIAVFAAIAAIIASAVMDRLKK